jgi:hypothetical protein
MLIINSISDGWQKVTLHSPLTHEVIKMMKGKKGKMPAIMIAIAMPSKKPKTKAEMKKEAMEDKAEMAALKAYAKKTKKKGK